MNSIQRIKEQRAGGSGTAKANRLPKEAETHKHNETRIHKTVLRAFGKNDSGIVHVLSEFISAHGCEITQNFVHVLADEVTAGFLVEASHQKLEAMENHAEPYGESIGLSLVSSRTNHFKPAIIPRPRGIELSMRAPNVAGLLCQITSAIRKSGYDIIYYVGMRQPIDYSGIVHSAQLRSTLEYVQSVSVAETVHSDWKALICAFQDLHESHGLLWSLK